MSTGMVLCSIDSAEEMCPENEQGVLYWENFCFRVLVL